MTNLVDLKTLGIDCADGGWVPQEDNSATVGNVSVFFRDQDTALINELKTAKFVLGAVAWLTSQPVLEALSNVDYGCAMVVQKEDFLRPEYSTPATAYRAKLRHAYSKLHADLPRYSLPGIAGGLSVACDPSVEPVRCVGNFNREKRPAMPRMHNKFLVLCDVCIPDEKHPDAHTVVKPVSVWTGSMNLTYNATLSFENSVLIKDSEIACAYAEEWAQIFALSEPLDWESDWVAPEYRIGT